MTDGLAPIFNLALAYDPRMGVSTFRDVYIPRMWVNNGCDVKLDCLPVMNDAMKRNGHIKAFNYFTNSIEAARDRRMARVAAEQDQPKEVKEDSEKAKAKSIAFLTRKLGKRMPHEERWLAEYEKQHGEVA